MEQKWNRRATSVNRTYYYRLDEREVALESTNLASRGTPLGPNGMVTNHALYCRVGSTSTGWQDLSSRGTIKTTEYEHLGVRLQSG